MPKELILNKMHTHTSQVKIFFLGAGTAGVLFLLLVQQLTYGWTNPTTNPTGAGGGTVFYSSGNVGIGTSSPAYALDVVGNINVTGNVLEGSLNVFATTTISYFNLASCPTGWSELTSARGRYIVGLPSGGTLAGTAGTALSNQENRVVGPHTHTNTISTTAHGHLVAFVSAWGDHDPADLGTIRRPIWDSKPVDSVGRPDVDSFSASGASAGINISNSASSPDTSISSTAGTNSPYIQLLVCQKS